MTESLPLSVIDDLLKAVSLTVSEIILWRKKLSKLKKELEKQEITEDDWIYNDLYQFLGKTVYEKPPLSKVYSIDGVELKVTIAHRHSGESVFGVDLVYEIIDKKIVLMQYKKSNQGRFQIDRNQMGKLRYFCYEKCLAKKIQHQPWFPKESRIISLCPCFYNMIVSPDEELIIPACVVESILDSKTKGRSSADKSEFIRGISRETFNEMFAKCWIGAASISNGDVNSMRDVLFSDDHIVIYCQESKFSAPTG